MLSKLSVKRPYTVVVGVVLIIILGIVSFQNMTVDLLPSMNLPYAIVATTYAGASPEEVEEVVTKPVEQTMATVSNIKTVQSISSENASTVVLEFDQTANMDAVTIEMRESLDQIQGFWPDAVSNPIIMKLNPDMMPVLITAVSAKGQDAGSASQLIQDEVIPEIESVEGVASVGVSGSVEEMVEVTLHEEQITQLNADMKAEMEAKINEAKSALEEAKSQVESGKAALEIGQQQAAAGLLAISRKDQSRYMSVTAEIKEGDNIGLVSNRVKKALESYDVPAGYEVEMDGEDATINEAMTELFKMLGLALVFMYLIMVAQFQSLRSPFIVMFTVPLAFTGGLLALWMSQMSLSVIAMIGFVMLSGIIVNNGIVFIDYTNQLMRSGMEQKDALVTAGKTRLRPIIMTALTTILGLFTLALGVGMGADMIQPMAVVTIGGLVYGTLLTLFVVPCIFDLFHRREKAGLRDEIEGEEVQL